MTGAVSPLPRCQVPVNRESDQVSTSSRLMSLLLGRESRVRLDRDLEHERLVAAGQAGDDLVERGDRLLVGAYPAGRAAEGACQTADVDLLEARPRPRAAAAVHLRQAVHDRVAAVGEHDE